MIRILTLAFECCVLSDFLSHVVLCDQVSGNVVVPISLDSSPTEPSLTALTIDLALSVVAVQRSVVARQGWSASSNRLIAEGAERRRLRAGGRAGARFPSLLAVESPRRRDLKTYERPAARGLLYGGFTFHVAHPRRDGR